MSKDSYTATINCELFNKSWRLSSLEDVHKAIKEVNAMRRQAHKTGAPLSVALGACMQTMHDLHQELVYFCDLEDVNKD